MKCYFQHVLFPKRTRLGVCDTCVQIQTAKKLATSATKKQFYQRRMFAHTVLHRAERKQYEQRAKDSERCPDRSWSVILDMLDKFLAPHKVYLLISRTCIYFI